MNVNPGYIWGYVEAAYGLCLGLIAWLSIGATVRLTRARRALARFEAS